MNKKTKKYSIEDDTIPEVAEPVATYGHVDTPHAQVASPIPPSDDIEESFSMIVEPAIGARRAEWGRKNFDRLLAEAEKLYGYEKGNDYTVEQYFGILRYTAEKCYEAIPDN